jgi:hypothetical protein
MLVKDFKRNSILFDASKEVDLEVNVKKTKYVLISRHQLAGQCHEVS